jgi:hypothetical protein
MGRIRGQGKTTDRNDPKFGRKLIIGIGIHIIGRKPVY